MMQTSAALSGPARPVPEFQEPSLLDPLLRLAGRPTTGRSLIIADHALELMCGLLRRGWLAVTSARVGARPDEADYGLVIIPDWTAVAPDDAGIRLVRRYLGSGGRLIAGAGNGRDAVALARRLRLNGFTDLRSTALPGLTLMRASLRRVA